MALITYFFSCESLRRKAILLAIAVLPAFVQVLALQHAKPMTPVPPVHRVQKHEYRQQVDQMEETWRQAVLKADVATLETLLADDYISISASGMLENREQTLANIRSGKIRFQSLTLVDRKVRFYGTTALVTSQAIMQGENQEGSISGNFRYTRVYVRNERGVWKVVSFEVSRIRDEQEKH